MRRPATGWIGAIIAAILTAAGSSPARADLVILLDDGSEAPPSYATKHYNRDTGGWDVHLNHLYAPGGWTVYEIHGNGREIIDNVFINVPCWQGPDGECVPAGSPVVVRVISQKPGGIKHVHNILQTGDAETLLNLVEVDQDIGSVTVEAMGRLEAGRDIIGPIIATTDDNPLRGITRLVAGRDLLGDAKADKGRIRRIEIERHIGTPEHPVTLRAKYSEFGIISNGDVYAEVNTRFDGGDGYLSRLNARSFVGTVETNRIEDSDTNIPGHVGILEHFDGSITIGSSFDDPGHWIRLPLHGLSGQIIINADNESDGEWDAPVKLGPDDHPDQIILTGPTYDYPHEFLGGGAVGLVPYRLHAAGSLPASGDDAEAEAGGEPLTIELHHFGPVITTNDTPLVIERKPIGSGDAYEPVALGQFTIAVDKNDPKRLLVGASSSGQGFEAGYTYRIEPGRGLRCDVDGLPPVQWTQPYVIDVVGKDCPADINGNGLVGVTDLLLMIAAWGSPAGLPQADLTGDGDVGVGDLLILINHWGPCP